MDVRFSPFLTLKLTLIKTVSVPWQHCLRSYPNSKYYGHSPPHLKSKELTPLLTCGGLFYLPHTTILGHLKSPLPGVCSPAPLSTPHPSLPKDTTISVPFSLGERWPLNNGSRRMQCRLKMIKGGTLLDSFNLAERRGTFST